MDGGSHEHRLELDEAQICRDCGTDLPAGTQVSVRPADGSVACLACAAVTGTMPPVPDLRPARPWPAPGRGRGTLRRSLRLR
jgi:hypothetical protein